MSTAELTRSRLEWLEMFEPPVELPGKMKVAPGTVENFKRGRLKRCGDFSEAVRTYFIEAITKLIERLNHELEMARKSGRNPDPSKMARLKRAMEKANELIGEEG